MNPKRLLLLIIPLGLLGWLGLREWNARSPDGAGVRASLDASIATETGQAPALSSDPPSELEDDAEASGGRAAEAMVSLETAAEQSSGKPVAPPTDPAAKYAGKSRVELEAALAMMKEKLLARQKEIIAERMAANQFTKFYVQPGQEVNLADLGLPEWQKGTGARPTSGRIRRSSKNDYVEVVAVPPGEYPDFDAMHAEIGWLYEHLEPSTTPNK